MRRWTHMVEVAPESYPLFRVWMGDGAKCAGCGGRVITVKAVIADGVCRLAERNLPGVKYGTEFRYKGSTPAAECGVDHPHKCATAANTGGKL